MNRQTLVKTLLEQGAFRATMAKFNDLLDQAEGTLALLSPNDFMQGLGNMVVYLRALASTKVSVFLDSQKTL